MKKEKKMFLFGDKPKRLRPGQAILIFLVLALLVLHTSSEPSYGATYYVSPSGSDSSPGTEAQPWQTIQKAEDTLVAGDTVYIRAGTYNERVVPQNSGSAGNYITYSAYPGETVIIDGTGITEGNDGVVVSQSYIKLEGLEVRNWNETGIWMENAGYIEISDCVVHDVSYGIGFSDGSHDFVLNRVEMYRFDGFGFDASPAGGADCYNGTLNDCVAHTGRQPGQNVDGFALGHGNQHDITFNRCVAYDVFDGFDIGENAGTQANIVLNRCLSYDCSNDGFKLTGGGEMVNCLSYHNQNSNLGLYLGDNTSGTVTLHSCTLMDSETFTIYVEDTSNSLHMYNCIIAGGDNIGLSFTQRDASNYTGDYNLFHNDGERAISVGYEDDFSLSQIESGAWTAYSGQDAHSLVAHSATEIFVDPTGFNLHLLSTSNAVDNGTSTDAPSDDYDGIPRPQGSGYDIGAYEYSSSPITTTAGSSTTTTAVSDTTTSVDGSTTTSIGESSTTTSCIEGDLCCIELTYGRDSEETKLLRYIRDNVLSKSPEGQELSKLYYEWSPAIIGIMEKDEEFREDVREMIDGVLGLMGEME